MQVLIKLVNIKSLQLNFLNSIRYDFPTNKVIENLS